jgi:major intracellular serine protease
VRAAAAARRGPDQIVIKFKTDADTARDAWRIGQRLDRSISRSMESGAILAVRPIFAEADARLSRGRMQLATPERTSAVDPELRTLHLAEVSKEETERTIDELLKNESVEYAHKVGVRYPAAKAAQAVGVAFPRQWGHRQVKLPAALSSTTFPSAEAAGQIVVAVIDTGVDVDHPDLQEVILEYKNFTSETFKDTDGHGTHVAGIVAARKSRQNGVEGVARCRILGLKALGDEFDGPAYYQSLRYATDHADVINLSLGGDEKDPTEILLIERAIKRNRIVVAAMGNERQEGNQINYPAVIKGVIAVGASDKNDHPADFSNTGKHIVLAAPGVAILSTFPGGKYARWDGTSMATPYVSGAIALLLATGKFTAPKVRARLIRSLDRVRGAGFSTELGYGRLNIQKLLGKA